MTRISADKDVRICLSYPNGKILTVLDREGVACMVPGDDVDVTSPLIEKIARSFQGEICVEG